MTHLIVKVPHTSIHRFYWLIYITLIDFAWETSPSPAIEKEECVWGIPDETSDVVLEVEGRELYANRAVLAHYSPVFGKMFFSDFK